VIRKLAREVLNDLGCRDNAELSVLLTDNAGIQKLNKLYLKKDRPTDVLSFPMYDFKSELSGKYCQPVVTDAEPILGDIVISVEIAKAQADVNGVTLNQEMARLLIHGILHLLGFDHEKGRKEALRMKKEELIVAIAKAEGIAYESPKKDEATIRTVKQDIRALRKQKEESLASNGERSQIERLRRRVKGLKRLTRKLAREASRQEAPPTPAATEATPAAEPQPASGETPSPSA